MNKTLKTLTLALALTSLVMALGSQIPSILPMSPVTEPIIFEKDATVQGIFGLNANSRNLKTWWNFEDFIGEPLTTMSGIWSLTSSGTGAYSVEVGGTALRPGIHRLSTGTTTTGDATVSLIGPTAPAEFLFGAGVYTMEGDIYISTLSDGTDTYTLRFGFGDSISGAPTDGAYFYYTDVGGGGATPNWYMNTVSNSSITSTVTTTAVVAGAWIRLKVIVNAAGTSVEYFINGASVGTNTTNIPTGTSRHTSAAYYVIKSAGTTARTVDIDWAWLHIDLTTSR